MVGPVQNLNGLALPVTAKDIPPEGKKIIPLTLVLTPTDFALSNALNLGSLNVSQIRALTIDNSENAQSLAVIHGVGLQQTIVPAGGGAIIPTTSNSTVYNFFISTTSAPPGSVDIGVSLSNYEIPPAIWGTQVITLSGTLPIGSILLWYGSAATIPAGFGLCDGGIYVRSDGAGNIASPNLVGVFALGANAASAGTSGGSSSISQANLPNVNFTVNDPGHDHIPADGTSFVTSTDTSGSASLVTTTGAHDQLHPLVATTMNATTGISVNSGGSGAAFLPPYSALCFIMKY